MSTTVPVTESPAEKALVSECCKTARRMGAYLELAGQLNARGSGSTVGLPDGFLYASGRCVPVEFKAGRNQLTDERAACYAKRLDQHVDTAVIRSETQFAELINECRRGTR